MSEHEGGSGTGNVKITEGYLEEFAKQKINEFIRDFRDNDDFRNLDGFAGGPKGPGGYAKLLAGGKDFPAGQALQLRYEMFCKSLKQQLDSFNKSMGELSNDLVSVGQILDDGEKNTELTAAQMMENLQDILGGLGGGYTPPPNAS
ncbi:hypothetical protein [Streptomyces sp. NPDC059080]|uniref:hypothetical protein n=1 Tax=Streptomyces sp. NPDC059080 TaxID=3346718 RepID=UPI0036AB0617